MQTNYILALPLALLPILYSQGKGDVHCQVEKVSGNLPMFWGWLPDATYAGNETFHEVVYDQWTYNVSNCSICILLHV